MTAKRAGNLQWCEIPILIRADIAKRSWEQGIDISSECNRALADRLGIDYSQQTIPKDAGIKPVIIASDPVHPAGGAGSLHPERQLPPVMNAEDPETPVRVTRRKKEPAPPPVQDQPHLHDSKDRLVPDKDKDKKCAPPEGLKRAAGQKKGRDDVIRRFINEKIVRMDSGNGRENMIAKDEMYQLFTRWCRAHSAGKIPDKRSFSVAMKNRFVIEESTAEGTRYWINIRLR